jgi:putative ABC transport system permease protein
VLLYGLRFEVVGVFRERVDTFGQSEVSSYTAIIPMSVMRYFKETEAVDMIYASAADLTLVPQVTDGIKSVLQGRHRRESLYRVQNLTEILSAASKISLGLTIVLLLIAAISLVSSGIGIMNIMLITVTERTREIGIKKAVGATRGVVLLQFLSESVVLSLGGGLIGILVGTSLPFSVAFFAPSVKIEFSWVSVAVGLAATVAVGVVFGLLPAGRAARLDPVECLRHE